MSWLRDTMFIVGWAACVAAIWQWNVRLGIIAAGVSLMFLATALSFNAKRRANDRDT